MGDGWHQAKSIEWRGKGYNVYPQWAVKSCHPCTSPTWQQMQPPWPEQHSATSLPARATPPAAGKLPRFCASPWGSAIVPEGWNCSPGVASPLPSARSAHTSLPIPHLPWAQLPEGWSGSGQRRSHIATTSTIREPSSGQTGVCTPGPVAAWLCPGGLFPITP